MEHINKSEKSINKKDYCRNLKSYQALKDTQLEAYKRAEQNMTKLLVNLQNTV